MDQAVMGAAANSFGWDTVFAIRVADANTQLARSSGCPRKFSGNQEDIAIEGTFGPWAITTGGGGTNLCFSVPITTGTMRSMGQSATMAGALATIEVALDLVPQPGATSGNGINDLMFATKPAAPDQPAVAVTQLAFPAGQDPGSLARALMVGGLSNWFNANLEFFTHIFASVSINGGASQGDFAWLAPTWCGYAYADGVDETSSVLGILSAVGHDPVGNLSGEIALAAIPDGARAGFTISQQSLLKYMILPSLPSVFPGSTLQDFTISADGQTLSNVNRVSTKSVEHDGITYHPVVDQLTITVVGTQLQIFTLTITGISPGITAHGRSTYYLALSLDQSSGSPKLTWSQAQAPLVEHWTQTSEGVQIAEAILAIIAIVVVVILGIITDGAFFIIAAMIATLLLGAAAATPELIAAITANSVGNEVPSIDALTLNATDPIGWTGAKVFALTSAGLNGGFQLGGNPFPAT